MKNTLHPATEQIISQETQFWNFCSFNGLTKTGLDKMVRFTESEFPNCKDLVKKVIYLFEDSDFSPLMFGVNNFIDVYKRSK
jgi:hypothetical protein